MAQIGFSTGILNRLGIPMKEGLEAFLSAGADAVELSFGTPREFEEFKLKESVDLIKRFSYVSIHAPWKGLPYPYSASNDDDGVFYGLFSNLHRLNRELPIKSVVMHPDQVDDFMFMDGINLPIDMENMDKRKRYGTNPDYFKMFKDRFKFGFVLDVQHAYEHDPSMRMASEFLDVMNGRLKHFHVSGCMKDSKHSHTQINYSENRNNIAGFLIYEKCGRFPWILEGIPSKDFTESLKEEIECARNMQYTSLRI